MDSIPNPNHIGTVTPRPGEHPLAAWARKSWEKWYENSPFRPRPVSPIPTTTPLYACPSLTPLLERAGDLEAMPEVVKLKTIQEQWDKLDASASGLSVDKVLAQRQEAFRQALAEGGDLNSSEMPTYAMAEAECTRKWQHVQSLQTELFAQAAPLIRAVNAKLSKIAMAMADQAEEAEREFYNLFGVGFDKSPVGEVIRGTPWHLENWLRAAERTTPKASPRSVCGHYLPLKGV